MSPFSAIPRLLRPRCPAAISGLIVAVWSGKTIQSCIHWAWAHVFQKHFKVVPSLAKADAATAISLPGAISRIPASLTRMIPTRVFAGLAFVVSAARTWLSFARFSMSRKNFPDQATTTLRGSMSLRSVGITPQIAAFYNSFFAAIAETYPFRSLWNDGQMPPQHQQTTYAFSG